MHACKPWRLGRRPALDGLRGVAILLVIVNHVDMPTGHYAGQVGVTAFFVLSGFLITSLLLEEARSTDRIRVGAFYLRRAFRLVPALVVCVCVVTGFAAFVGVPLGRGGAPAALLYVMDFVQSGHGEYQPGLFAHTWSLAVEEQFYLVWPLMLVGLLRLRVRLVSALSVLTISAAGWLWWMSATAPIARVAYAPDTQAFALLAGCALAAAMTSGRVRRAPRWVAVTALVALPALGWAPNFGIGLGPQLVGATASTVLVVWAIADGWEGPLGWRPLRVLGERSYGVYLWHFPMLGFVLYAAPTTPWWARALIALTLTAVVVELSWRFVEQPLRRRGRLIAAHGRAWTSITAIVDDVPKNVVTVVDAPPTR